MTPDGDRPDAQTTVVPRALRVGDDLVGEPGDPVVADVAGFGHGDQLYFAGGQACASLSSVAVRLVIWVAVLGASAFVAYLGVIGMLVKAGVL